MVKDLIGCVLAVRCERLYNWSLPSATTNVKTSQFACTCTGLYLILYLLYLGHCQFDGFTQDTAQDSEERFAIAGNFVITIPAVLSSFMLLAKEVHQTMTMHNPIPIISSILSQHLPPAG